MKEQTQNWIGVGLLALALVLTLSFIACYEIFIYSPNRDESWPVLAESSSFAQLVTTFLLIGSIVALAAGVTVLVYGRSRRERSCQSSIYPSTTREASTTLCDQVAVAPII